MFLKDLLKQGMKILSGHRNHLTSAPEGVADIGATGTGTFMKTKMAITIMKKMQYAFT